jgi:hypothetical protein
MFAKLISSGFMGGSILGPAECKDGGTPTSTCLTGASPVLLPKCWFGWTPAYDDE